MKRAPETRADAWRDRLTVEHLALIERQAGPTLRAAGY